MIKETWGRDDRDQRQNVQKQLGWYVNFVLAPRSGSAIPISTVSRSRRAKSLRIHASPYPIHHTCSNYTIWWSKPEAEINEMQWQNVQKQLGWFVNFVLAPRSGSAIPASIQIQESESKQVHTLSTTLALTEQHHKNKPEAEMTEMQWLAAMLAAGWNPVGPASPPRTTATTACWPA